MEEKRGPIEKTSTGWPINPFGLAAIAVIFILLAILVGKPLLTRSQQKQENFVSSQIESPKHGELVNGNVLPIKVAIDNPSKVSKVVFWVKTYADNKWEEVGEDMEAPFALDWQIPSSYQNKSIAITTHVYGKNGEIAKDLGGWREGIIILQQ